MLSTNRIIKSVAAGTVTLMTLTLLSSCTSSSVKTASPDITTPKTISTKAQISESDREKFNAGLGALSSDDLSTAERIFSDLIEEQPSLAGPYCNMALIYLKKKEYQKSIETIAKALKLNDGIAQAYDIRAQALVATGKIKDAERDYISAVTLDSKYANAHYNLALLYDIYYQEIGKAIKHYETYLSLLDRPDKSTQEWVNHLKGALKHG
jgi:tetratricopeptide (TPR) repeat protein